MRIALDSSGGGIMNKNKFNTPFIELYPTFQDYQRHEAETMLSMLGTCYDVNGFKRNLDDPAIVRMYGLQNEKRKLEEHRAHLRAYISEEQENPIYRAYYDYLSVKG